MRILSLALTLVLASSASRATTIDPMLWQQLVEGAAFVGVVECDRAGGIVAGFRVVETWKGSEQPGASITIRTAVNIWEPQYPLTLVGDRLVVTAYAGSPPSHMTSTSTGPSLPPVWARRLPASYELPLFQGAARVDERSVGGPFGSTQKMFADFKREVMAYVGQPDDARELVLLKALVEKYQRRERDAATGATAARVKRATSLAQAVEILVASRGLLPGRWPEWVLRSAGPRARALAKLPSEDEPAGPPPPAPPAPSPAQLEAWRATVRAGATKEDAFTTAVAALLTHDCPVVAAWLKDWVNDEQGWAATDRGYFLGSWVGLACKTDRARALTTLLEAREPFVRVAGAVYLAYEDERVALPHLEKLSALEGDPGAWAALTLARRGDGRALARAIAILDDVRGESGMADVPHRNLQKRVLELLSNTAAVLHEPTPVHTPDDKAAALARAWLKAHPDAKPVDPWWTALAAQKVD